MKISIIIPAYNCQDCLERSVRSVCAQTHSDLELIIVDDGSADSTGEIADALALTDPRIRVLHQSNGGTSRARNAGIRTAKCEYIGFVDADDDIEPDMYERLLGFILEKGLKCAQICRDERAADGKPLPMVVTPPEKPKIIDSKDFLKELLLHRGDCSMCTKLTHRSLFETGRSPDGELTEDFRIFVGFLENMDGVGSLPETGYHVNYREGSNTRTDTYTFSRVFKDIVVNADRAEELVARKYPELSVYARRFALVQRLDYMMHIPVPQMDRGDSFYTGVVGYLRRHRADIRSNPYLSDDQRNKLRIMSVAPRLARTVHSMIKSVSRGRS